jgi:hypothetical protein
VLAAVVGLAGSSALAALGGVLLARFGNAVFVPGQEISFTLGAVLLGGVSVFGWRGGVAGTALAVSLLVILGSWLAASDAEGWQVTMGAGIAIIVGLVVNLILRAALPSLRYDDGGRAHGSADAGLHGGRGDRDPRGRRLHTDACATLPGEARRDRGGTATGGPTRARDPGRVERRSAVRPPGAADRTRR